MTELLVGIDVGTQSSKGVLTRLDGTVVAEARAQHGMDVPRPGLAEQDADAVWWADVCSIARRLVAAVPPGEWIAAAALSAIGPTVLPVDEDLRPLRKAILYGVDTRATAQIAALEARHGAANLAAWSGMDLSSQAAGPKIAWLAEHKPELTARTRWYLTATSYLVARLTGALAIDPHTASHFNPLFDRSTLGWSERYADGINGIARLPPIRWPAEVAGVVSEVGASETGLPAGIPVAVGTVDAMAEAMSVGVLEPGDLMVMYGSTTFFILVAAAPVEAGSLWLTAGAEPGRWAIAAGLATGGSALAWFRDQLAHDLVEAEAAGGDAAFAALSREAEAAAAEEIVFLPYFSGERTPINDPLARGVAFGLSLQSGRGDLYRGLLRGIAYAARANLRAMRDLGAPIARAVAVGGGTADPSLVQAVSDACGIEQVVPSSTIGAARGDAMLAGLAAGLLDRAKLADWVLNDRVIVPDGTARAAHDRRAATFDALYPATRDIVHRLARDGVP